ncbi:MAG: right-handed parallel beta-helix repeat-containing protein, partial [Candidatus Thorarchaeota archaeon]
MKTKTQKLKSLLVLGLLFPLILICNFNYNINYEPKIEDPKTSDTYNGIFIDDTISNNGTSWGNWTWARTQSWCTKGNGTKGNPYVIEDSIFLSAGPSDCLLIQNSIKHFIIENCTFKDIPVADFAGIKLNNVTNGLIENNRVYNNSHGIFLYKSSDNNITGNVVHDNINSGIYLRDTCNQNNIINNTANNNKWGIILDYGSSPGPTNNRIINNTANYNSEDGIYNKMCDYNNFTANILNYNKNRGIFIEGGSIFNNIINNTARWNGI